MTAAQSPTAGRVCIVLAALLWSTSGGFGLADAPGAQLSATTTAAMTHPSRALLSMSVKRAARAQVAWTRLVSRRAR